MVDQPRRTTAGGDHRGRVDDGDQHGHPEIAIHEGPGCLMAFVKVGGSAKPKIDWYEHQSRAVSDCHGEGPKPQLRRPYPRQRPWMASVDKPEDTEPDDKQAGRHLYLVLPFDERHQRREGKEN